MLTPLQQVITIGVGSLTDIMLEYPNLSNDEIDKVIAQIADELTPVSAEKLIQFMLADKQLFFTKVNGKSAMDFIFDAMIQEIKDSLTNEVFIQEEDDMPKDWIDRHSVNCYYCEELVDERECVPADPYNGNDGGSVCQPCIKDLGLEMELKNGNKRTEPI